MFAEKAASTIVGEFVEELVQGGVIAKRSVLRIPKTLTANGGCIFSTVASKEYCKAAFDPAHLGQSNRLRAFVQLSMDITSEDELYAAIATVLCQECSFVPKAVMHEGRVKFSSTHFQVLTTVSLSDLLSSRRPWREPECMPFLLAAQSTVLRVLSLKPSTCKEVTR